jgi:FkbM family methyltransferase
VIATGTYEPALTALVHALLREGDVFVDIGANEGYFSVVAAGLVKDGRVLAFEPQSRLDPVVRENLRLNHCGNVDFYPIALSDSAGTISIHLASSTQTGASSIVQSPRFSRQETVRTRTFDDVAAERGLTDVRLVKIDCEGAEHAILRGAERFLAAGRAQFLSVDYHESIVGTAVVRQIDATLRGWGYVVSEAANGCWVYHRPGAEAELVSLGKSRAIPPL